MSTEVFVRGSAPVARRRRRWTGPVVAVAVIALTTLLVYEPPSSGITYDPTSRAPDGLAVLVAVLDEVGVDIDVADELPDPVTVDAVVVPPLGWTPDDVARLVAGGTRVVSSFPPVDDAEQVQLAFTGVGLVTRDVDCALLRDVSSLRSTSWGAWTPPVGSLSADADRCVVDGASAWLTVATEEGGGQHVSLGTFAPLINDRMREQDAAVAAVRLLGVRPGDRVVALTTPDATTAPPTLADLVDRRWFDAAWLTLLVLLLAAMARGRRLGRVVGEQLPVRVPSGELARAVGDLRHRTGANATSADVLRHRTLALVGARLGVGASPDGATAVAALRSAGVVVDDLQALALTETPAPDLDEEGLTVLVDRLASVRDTVLRGGSATPTTADGHADDRGRTAADPAPSTSDDQRHDRASERPEQP